MKTERLDLAKLCECIRLCNEYLERNFNPPTSVLEDGGSCNFDAPAVLLKCSRRKWETFNELLDESIGYYWRKECDQRGYHWYVLNVRTYGQGELRTRMAEAATQFLNGAGYTARTYYQVD